MNIYITSIHKSADDQEPLNVWRLPTLRKPHTGKPSDSSGSEFRWLVTAPFFPMPWFCNRGKINLIFGGDGGRRHGGKSSQVRKRQVTLFRSGRQRLDPSAPSILQIQISGSDWQKRRFLEMLSRSPRQLQDPKLPYQYVSQRGPLPPARYRWKAQSSPFINLTIIQPQHFTICVFLGGTLPVLL